ncbi:MAG: hypothetical protein Q6361_01985 [Candidatus Hermodarchaeota archaeon]|nr:hypothetical protein [Candidatus Hermodarchaeota archaeon]
MNEIVEADDFWHEASNHRDWRESWYFNWVDLDSSICGFSTVALLPNLPKREFVIAVFIDGLPKLYLTEPMEPIPKDFDVAMSDGTLRYHLHQPLEEWTIDFQGQQFQAEIQWQQRFPAYDFGPGSGITWGRHFEQSGKVTGTVTLAGGQTHHFRGLGQRDKSWGVRDWHIDGWFHMMAQFDDFMIGFRQDRVKGKEYVSGCICTDQRQIPITQVQVETEFEEDAIRKPVRGRYCITDSEGTQYTLTSELMGPLTFGRYTRQFSDGFTELFEQMVIYKYHEKAQTGAGLAEYIFTHPLIE